MAAAWRAIDSALRPVIGANGVAALYARSLNLAAHEHLWLLDAGGDVARQIGVAPLTAQMAKRTLDEAASAAQCLLRTFEHLFSGLVGDSLAAQLLRSVYEESWEEAPEEGRTT